MYLDPAKYKGDMINHEKMHMFARDIIRVKNPLDKDFRFKYDSVYHTVKAGGTKDMERYLAEAYFNNISQYILNQQIAAMSEQAVIQYAKTNPNILMDKYIENRQVIDKLPRNDDRKLLSTIAKDVIVGLVEKYGEDREDTQREAPKAVLPSSTPLYKELMDQMTSVPIDEMPVNQPISDVQEVTVNDGQEVT